MASQTRVTGGAVLAALVSGALAAGTLTGAPTANATCASFFGIGNTADCSSTLTTSAIAVGTGATAHATGLFGTAFAIGGGVTATSNGVLGFAFAQGRNSLAIAGVTPDGKPGFGNIAVAIGSAGPNNYQAAARGIGNVALNLFGQGGAGLSHNNNTYAIGVLNMATNLGGSESAGNHLVQSWGNLNSAINLGGNNNTVLAGSIPPNLATGSVAFNVLGSGNTVKAYPGPLAVAGALNQNAVTVTQRSPGINVYTRLALGAASVSHAGKTSSPAATAVRTGNTPAAPTAAAHTPTKMAAPAATAVRTGNTTAAPAAAAHTPTKKAAPAATATSRGKR